MPIINLTQGKNFSTGVTGTGDVTEENAFALYNVLPGGTMVSNTYPNYPLANIAVAANAQYSNPLRMSLLMNCPVRGEGGYQQHLTVMSALQKSLHQHANTGGYFNVATPKLFYPNGLLTDLRDVSGGDTKQNQTQWQWDFEFPLITLDQAQQAQNSLMARTSKGVKVEGDPPTWSGVEANGIAPSVAPSSTSSTGASVHGSTQP